MTIYLNGTGIQLDYRNSTFSVLLCTDDDYYYSITFSNSLEVV